MPSHTIADPATTAAIACATCQAPPGAGCTSTLTGEPLPDGYMHAPRWIAAQPTPEPQPPAGFEVFEWTSDNSVVTPDGQYESPADDTPERYCSKTLLSLTPDEQHPKQGVHLSVAAFQDWSGQLGGAHVYLSADTELTARQAREVGTALTNAGDSIYFLFGDATTG